MNLKIKKCTQCGANLSNSSYNETVTCEYCGTVFSIEKTSIDNTKTDDDIQIDVDIQINIDTKTDVDICIIPNQNNEVYGNDDFSTSIILTCTNYAPKNYDSCTICGVMLETTDNKFYPNAAIRFKIPANEHIYYISDCSILRGCRKGYAIGYNGIYYCSEQKITGFISWSDFIHCTLKRQTFGMLQINDLVFNTGATGKASLLLLEQIQATVRKFF